MKEDTVFTLETGDARSIDLDRRRLVNVYEACANGTPFGAIAELYDESTDEDGNEKLNDYTSFAYCVYDRYNDYSRGYYFGRAKTDSRHWSKLITFPTLFQAKKTLENEWMANGKVFVKRNTMAGAKLELLTDLSGNKGFYPTPSTLAGQMIEGIKNFDKIESVLEPSAGKGNLVDCLIGERHRIRDRSSLGVTYSEIKKKAVDCVEMDPNLQNVLRGKGYRVVHDDFMTFATEKSYDLILMNPPFSEGVEHLEKALNMQERYGGQVCCLLNAETIRNPYTAPRQRLVKRLKELKASFKFVKNAFRGSERSSDVEVVIIWVNIPAKANKSKLIEGLEKAAAAEENKADDVTMLCLGDFVSRLVSQYNMETKLCSDLIKEYNAIKPYLLNAVDATEYSAPVIQLNICGSEYNGLNDALEALRYKYWYKLFHQEELMSKFTSDLQKKYMGMLDDMRQYEFSEFNIRMILARMNAELTQGVKDSILRLFEKFTTHAMDDGSENVHYFNGWKTNRSYKVKMKVIIPAYGCFSDWGWNKDHLKTYECYNTIGDIEKTLRYLDGKEAIGIDISRAIEMASNCGQKKVETIYFTAMFYKKGTVHITFRPEYEYLIDAFNIFCCGHNNWLPPCYGKKSYDEMTEEEKAVINEFQGKEKYEEVMASPETYLPVINEDKLLLM